MTGVLSWGVKIFAHRGPLELPIFEARDTGTMALSSSARSATPERRFQARVKHALERREKFDRQTTG
jgi:hypothetical protein